MAERSYPTSEVRGSGREELPHAPKPEARGEGWTGYPMPSCPRPGVEARRSNPISKEPWLHGCRSVHGHTHVPELKTLECGMTIFNPGSVSLPKGGSSRSFGYYDGENLKHYVI